MLTIYVGMLNIILNYITMYAWLSTGCFVPNLTYILPSDLTLWSFCYEKWCYG